MRIRRSLLFLILVISFNNCTKPVDFDQIDEANFDATYITTLIHLNLTSSNFLDDLNKEITVKSDVIEVPLSNEVEPYLEKVEFTILTKNSFNRVFELYFIFFDEFSTPIYTLKPTVIVPENSSELITILEIPPEDISVIFSTEFIGANVVMLPSNDGSIISENETSEFNLKSSMKLFINY